MESNLKYIIVAMAIGIILCVTLVLIERAIRRKIEFSKILAVWAVAVATLDLASSFLLAAFDKQPVSDLSIAAFTACTGYLVTYAGKSAFEKHSRNQKGLDENGKPHDMKGEEST
jgi:ABC-type Fe3+-siderophore transport system permease subunit